MTCAMRFAVLGLGLGLAASVLACGNQKSKLDVGDAAAVDALWELAPDGTQLGIVASPRAVGLGFRALAAARELTKQPDFNLVKPQIDAVSASLFGSDTATPAEAGFAVDRAFAMFDTGEGVIGVMPVGDRDKYLAAKKGTRGSAEDTLDGTTCRPHGRHYVCATRVELFARLGKGNLRGKLALAGVRGDAELYMAATPLLGDAKGELAVAAQLEPGQVSLHGRWLGPPSGPLQSLVGLAAPRADTKGASGFVAINLGPLLANAPAVPVAGELTFDQLVKSFAGPVTATIPSGSVDIQIFAPLTDPKPAETAIASCADIKLMKLAKTQTPGACRFELEGTNALELDAWVEASTLRLGAKKGPVPAGKPGGMTPAGGELASGNWTAAFWGRGTMLNLSGITPAKEEVPPEVALSIHAMALVNELGAGARVDKDGLRFRAFIRTAWANPPAIVDRIVAIGGNDIVTGKATEAAKAIAVSAAGAPFAADYDAGQGGLMIPAAMIGLASAVVVPAVMRMAGVGGEQASGLDNAPMDQTDLTTLLLRAYVEEAYPKWQADNPGKQCPAKLDEVAKYFGADPGLPVLTDPWGHALVMKCDAKGFVVSSLGPDGKADTPDDVRP
jgi:hypothetical protein